MRPQYEVAQIVHQYGEDFLLKYSCSSQQRRTLRAISQCRTATLGGHVDACDTCGHIRVSYNSCRNRHCPKCQNTHRERWIMDREQDLLPVGYFHVVFTLPQELNPLCLKHPRDVYNLLFESAWETIQAFSLDPKHLGAMTGMIAVLHTWGQTLSLHPHLHCILPGGGITIRGKWKHSRSHGKYLFPKKALSKTFRGKFLDKLKRKAGRDGLNTAEIPFDQLWQKKWVVYAKQPLAGPSQIIEYLGRYTHKVAISNHRLISIDQGKICFRYKDYRDAEKHKNMELQAGEFLRRFCLHVLPPGFVRIRHYGILSCHNKSILRSLTGKPQIKQPKPDWKQICRLKLNFDPDVCPCCHKGNMITVSRWTAGRDPPFQALNRINHD